MGNGNEKGNCGRSTNNDLRLPIAGMTSDGSVVTSFRPQFGFWMTTDEFAVTDLCPQFSSVSQFAFEFAFSISIMGNKVFC